MNIDIRKSIAPTLAACALVCTSPLALAASGYSQTWSGADTAGWEANTISSTVVLDASVGNPAGSLATRRSQPGDIGYTSGSVPALAGSFGSTPWTVSFDLQFGFGEFTNVALRYRFQDSTFNGWRYAFAGPFVDGDTWTHYTVSFDPTWSDAEAIAHGWSQEAGPVVGFAETLSNAYKTEVRLAGNGTSLLAHLDNFSATPVPVPPAFGLLLGGLALLRRRLRRA